jgi:hypothetical protein
MNGEEGYISVLWPPLYFVWNIFSQSVQQIMGFFIWDPA